MKGDSKVAYLLWFISKVIVPKSFINYIFWKFYIISTVYRPSMMALTLFNHTLWFFFSPRPKVGAKLLQNINLNISNLVLIYQSLHNRQIIVLVIILRKFDANWTLVIDYVCRLRSTPKNYLFNIACTSNASPWTNMRVLFHWSSTPSVS